MLTCPANLSHTRRAVERIGGACVNHVGRLFFFLLFKPYSNMLLSMKNKALTNVSYPFLISKNKKKSDWLLETLLECYSPPPNTTIGDFF